MVPFFYAMDVTAYFRVRRVEHLYEGLVDLVHGADALCEEHRCAKPRGTEAEALRDARKEASVLVKGWQAERRRRTPPRSSS